MITTFDIKDIARKQPHRVILDPLMHLRVKGGFRIGNLFQAARPLLVRKYSPLRLRPRPSAFTLLASCAGSTFTLRGVMGMACERCQSLRLGPSTPYHYCPPPGNGLQGAGVFTHTYKSQAFPLMRTYIVIISGAHIKSNYIIICPKLQSKREISPLA